MILKLSEIKPNPNNPRLIKSLKPIPNFGGYFVSPDGRLFSNRYRGFREIKGSPDQDGYLRVTLTRDDKSFVYKRLHRVIAEAFLGESNLEVNHIDGDKQNNNIKNLEYVSLRENQCHRRKSNVGVCWANKEGKCRAYIQHNKKWYHLGFYNTPEEAKEAYLAKALELNVSLKYAV